MTEPQPAPPDQTYPLFLREGTGSSFFRLSNHGLMLTAEGFAWSYDGQERRRGFGDVDSVRLQVVHVHKSGDYGTCEIRFRDGLILRIVASTAYGFADDEQSRAYAACVRDLHGRLAASGAAIRYHAGTTDTAHTAGVAIMVVAALFFIGTPIVIFLMVRKLEVLGILLAAAAFIWPFWRKLQVNAPRAYTPQAVPADLLP